MPRARRGPPGLVAAGTAVLQSVIGMAEAEQRRGTRFRRSGRTLLVSPPAGADAAAQDRALAAGELLDMATALGGLLASVDEAEAAQR